VNLGRLPFNALGGERDAIWERYDENGSRINPLAHGWHPLPIK
jgi:hypothetical protein